MLARHAHVGRVAPRRHRDAAVLLEQPVDVVAEAPLRPAAHDLARIQPLVLHARRVHAVAVAAERNGALPRSEVEPAGPQHDLLPGIALQLRPGLVGELGQLDIAGGVVGEPDDPRVVLRLAPDVAQLELLQPEHFRARSPREPVGGRAAEAAEAQDDVFEVGLHGRDRSAAAVGGRTSCHASRLTAVCRPPVSPPRTAECPGSSSPSARNSRSGIPASVIPRCTDSQMAQSCRFTRSQKSTASEGSKSGLRHLGGMEEELADHGGPAGGVGADGEDGHVLGREAEQEVGIDQLTLVPDALVLAQAVERRRGWSCRCR